MSEAWSTLSDKFRAQLQSHSQEDAEITRCRRHATDALLPEKSVTHILTFLCATQYNLFIYCFRG